MIAGHIDSLTAKLKPISKKPVVEGYVQLGVAPYSGALNSTWWDRDLGIAGRVIVKTAQGKIETKLVKLDWPIARVSTLAPHFGAPANGPFNLETQMTPVIGLERYIMLHSLLFIPKRRFSSEDDQGSLPAGSFAATQPARLIKVISSELGITDCRILNIPAPSFTHSLVDSSILNWELELYEFAPGNVGGLSKEFIFAPRLDDKLCSWAALQGLIEASRISHGRGTISMCALYDDEEVGSKLRQGAVSNLMSEKIPLHPL